MDQEKLRLLLCELGAAIRSKVVSARQGLSAEKLAAVTGDAGGDTIFAIDRFGEDAILEWFRSQWPADEPVQIVMEGLESELCFPKGKSAAETLPRRSSSTAQAVASAKASSCSGVAPASCR